MIYNRFTLPWFRVSYRDGVMEHEPRPCAAVKGTQIMVGKLMHSPWLLLLFHCDLFSRKYLCNKLMTLSLICDIISGLFMCEQHYA